MRRAFTLIELLVVIAIIVVLAGLVLAVVPMLRERARGAQTSSGLAAVMQALSLAEASRGGLPGPAEHPLAGSRADRLLFRGRRGASQAALAWTDLARSGEALAGPEPWQLADDASRARLLRPDDRFADPDLPLLYGLERGAIGVLGTQMQAATRYRRLPTPAGGALAGQPYTASGTPPYPDADWLFAPAGGAEDAKRALDYLFGAGSAMSELGKLGTLRAPASDDAAERALPPATITGLDNAGRVVRVAGSTTERWEDDRRPGATVRVAGAWTNYQLRGPAFYDAWRREILYTVSSDGRVRLSSAGRDGVFRWHPGIDSVLQTPAEGDAAAGDDRDGARDNLVLSE